MIAIFDSPPTVDDHRKTTSEKGKENIPRAKTEPVLPLSPFPSSYTYFKSTSIITLPIVDTNMRVTRAISLTNFMVATSALGFQVFVLYPWHKELDTGFKDLKKEHMKVLDAVGKSVSEQQRMAFSNRLSELKTESSRRWWWM